MFFFDPLYFLFALPPLALMIYAQIKVRSTYTRFSKVQNLRGVTGIQVARTLLAAQGLSHVRIEQSQGMLTDHYDPRGKVLRFSPDVYNSASVAALGIVAHEIGHALQDEKKYFPMTVRSTLVLPANIGTYAGYVFFILGMIISIPQLVWVGVALFSAAVLFSMVTLPVELDASHRARKMLLSQGLVAQAEYNGASAVLTAAALTYVASMLQAVANLLYYVFAAVGMGRRD
ncbi:MAG: zinc metallopeptidase [Chloroflexi bacterium]|nr:zinc metallopeptidase [Chloroflexota bacterium]